MVRYHQAGQVAATISGHDLSVVSYLDRPEERLWQMPKKTSHKQSTKSPDTSLKVRKFPLESIKLLQRELEIADKEYPRLAHVLMLRSEPIGDEQLDEESLKAEFDRDKKLGQAVGTFQDFLCYKRLTRGIFPFERVHPRPGSRIVLPDPTPSSNVCQFWQYGSGLEYKSGRNWIHFLCQTRGECWNKEKATQRFLELAELTGGFLVEPTIIDYFGLSREMQHLPYPVDRWLVALHECGFAKVCNPTLPENLSYMVTDLLLPITEHFLRSGRCAYLGAVPDMWLAWGMLCAEILDLAEKQREGQRVEKRQAPPVSDEPFKPLSKALMMLHAHPEWTDAKIAEEAGVARTTLYEWPEYKTAREILKSAKRNIARGHRDAETGKLEAWETD